MKHKLLSFVALLFLIACNQQGNFTVSGTLSDAAEEMLYFYKSGLVSDTLLDSVKLKESGRFKFKAKQPVYPELYRLKIGNRSLILGVDTRTPISVEGSAKDLLNAAISGSQTGEQIQYYRRSVLTLQDLYEQAETAQAEEQDALIETFKEKLEKHKNEVKALILGNPGSIVSYYALFQQISSQFIFTPYDKEDRPFFQAVATSFNTDMPDYDRTKNIYNIVVGALKDARQLNAADDWSLLDKAEERGYFEIELKNRNGYPQKLSDLEGNLILLDFSAYAMEGITAHTFELRDLHQNYHSKGLKIYQVSLDQNYNFWLEQSSSVPWTAVFDIDGTTARNYNVSQLPTLFLIDRSGNIVGRYEDIASAEAVIKRES